MIQTAAPSVAPCLNWTWRAACHFKTQTRRCDFSRRRYACQWQIITVIQGVRVQTGSSEIQIHILRVPAHYIVGNNDVGLGLAPSTTKRKRSYYLDTFGSFNQNFEIANHTVIGLDTPDRRRRLSTARAIYHLWWLEAYSWIIQPFSASQCRASSGLSG